MKYIPALRHFIKTWTCLNILLPTTSIKAKTKSKFFKVSRLTKLFESSSDQKRARVEDLGVTAAVPTQETSLNNYHE